ncbi:hypothetical protein PIB30_111095, partial [Stylosanthes scabra]|nr:hypothetical protein [Stylosanthes scabra]
VLASLHGREATERNHHRSMSIDAESHQRMHANNNPQVVHLAHNEEDPSKIERLQGSHRD